MMPKVTLLAPDNVRGEIHGSQTGKNYTIDGDGKVVVDAPDAGPLASHGGFTHAPRETSAIDDRRPPSNKSIRSTIEGATAIDPAAREASHRQFDPGTGQHNEDFGKAIPPHGLPTEHDADPATTAAVKVDAEAEVAAAERAGMDPTHRSAQANTGGMDQVRPNAGDQSEARGEPQETDAEREARLERERMPPESQQRV